MHGVGRPYLAGFLVIMLNIAFIIKIDGDRKKTGHRALEAGQKCISIVR
jgi:hypothetical protein